MKKFKTQEIKNLQQIVGGKSNIVIITDVVMLNRIVADEIVINSIIIIDEISI